MNFMQPPGQVDPRDLTSGQLAALRIVKEYRLSRVKNGWRAPGSPLVTLATMQILGAKRLVIRRDVNGKARIEVTGTGLNTLSVAEGRSRKSA
ncbi:hypothetical protein [Mesorhizobium sp.]|uniref:hypothetical protein n=1 Tax=Mesorhizobium sp. TaxID=1871066 RepID=UPI000FE53F49|nr:hypothetical protein [Mesorhizobium sp.]RWI96070.1 MAG: hypothetical protein EOR21_08555 [Mesorhizobium sp.]